jgi:hypothetical protein
MLVLKCCLMRYMRRSHKTNSNRWITIMKELRFVGITQGLSAILVVNV